MSILALNTISDNGLTLSHY